MLEKQVFVHGMKTLKEAISSFLHICFIANLEWHNSGQVKKDQVSKQDQSFKKSLETYKSKMYLLLRSTGMV